MEFNRFIKSGNKFMESQNDIRKKNKSVDNPKINPENIKLSFN